MKEQEQKELIATDEAEGNDGKMMTTRELADVLGVDVDTVLNAIKRIGFSEVLRKTHPQGGRPTMVFDEAQATAIKQEVQRHHNLATRQVDTVSTQLEGMNTIVGLAKTLEDVNLYKSSMLMVQMSLERMNERLAEKDAQLKAAQPKVDFYNTVVESTDAVDMKQAAKLLRLDMGRTKLFAFLRKKHVLMDDNEPYQEYVDKGYFRVVEAKFNLPDGTIKISKKTVVLQKGLDFIKRITKKEAV